MNKRDYTIMTAVVAVLLLFIFSAATCNPREEGPKPEYEENIRELFEEARECPAMIEQCKDPDYKRMLVEGTNCLSCMAQCLLYIRDTCDEWVDTIGEDPTSDTLTEDACAVIRDAENYGR